MKKILIIIFLITITVPLTSCGAAGFKSGSKESSPLPVYGIYERINSDGGTATVVVSSKTVKLSNVDFTAATAFYAASESNKYEQKKLEEGIKISKEEKDEYKDYILKNNDYSKYENAECEYKLKYSENDYFNIQIYDNNVEVRGLALTYYINKDEMGFSDSASYFKLISADLNR